jgi:SAM-dependent methyltransferase
VQEKDEGLEWQIGVWDRVSQIYLDEIDKRFMPIVRHCVELARLRPGEAVLDVGTGTGTAAVEAGRKVGAMGRVLGVDVSPEMVRLAEARIKSLGLNNVRAVEGRAEQIPADPKAFDALVACLSFMYVIDREAAAQECARVLRPGGRFVAAVWAGPEQADIVRFQQAAGKFAPPPPVQGVGPGALADPTAFLEQLRQAGIDTRVETETFTFDFDTFDRAWEVLAGVTTAQLAPERREEAKRSVLKLTWTDPLGPGTFRNTAQFLVGQRRS